MLFNITLMLVVSGVCSIILRRFRLPAIIGYLVAGILLGPYVLANVVVVDEATVSIFASLGIVLLMFYIGLELNLRGLKKVASFAMIIVAIEMALMVIIGYSLGLGLGLGSPQALFLGVTLSCASTAVVLGVMKDSPHMQGSLSKAVTGILVVEDIGLIIILALSAPIMGTSTSGGSMLDTIILVVAFIGVTVVIGLAVMPRFLNWVNRNYSGETLFLVAVGFGFGLSLVSSYIGLSEAIGAFLAGILISQSSCAKIVISKVEPMKEMFMAIFFLSIGMQLDPGLMISGLPLAVTIAAVFIMGKFVSVGIGCLAANFKTRSAFFIATSMLAMGEFTFVVAKIALDSNVIGGGLYSSVIGAALITMLLLPLLTKAAPKIFDAVVARMPPGVFRALDRIENARMEARGRMAQSAEVRRTVKRQLLYVFIDFIIILTILTVVNFLNTLDQLMGTDFISDSGPVSLVLFVASLILILPAIIHIVKRLQVISGALASAQAGDTAVEDVKAKSAYRFFRNISSAITFGLLIAVIFPFLPRVEGMPISIFEVMAGVAIISWLAWNTLESAYEKMSTALTKSLSDADQPEDEDKSHAH